MDDAPHSWATTNDGVRLAWWSTGAGEPLLLVAGQAVDASAWDPVLPDLARSFRVITYDHRGIARSEAGHRDVTTRSLAQDAVAVLDAAGVSRAHVYGHSMGGRVAQWLAADHPGRVGALVLGATSAGGGDDLRRSPDVLADLVSGDPARLADLFFTDPPEPLPRFFVPEASRVTLRRHFAASRAHDARGVLPSVTAPTLVIHGSEDRLAPLASGRALAALVPGAVLHVVDGARHGYYLDHPGATDVVVDFLRMHPLGVGDDGPSPRPGGATNPRR